MHCRVLGCDFDGTGASNGALAPEFVAALERAKAAGWTSLLVTGRVLEELRMLCGEVSIFDAVVAENGAVVWFPGSNRTIQLGTPPPDRFLAQLRAHGVPFHAGAVVVGTWEQHTASVLELIRREGIDGQLTFNRDALMVLPSGINKATGVHRALTELGMSEHNMVAFGDAENDLPLLAAAELGVAARGSVDAVAALADERLTLAGGAGVARFVHDLLDRGGSHPTPRRQQIVLGESADGHPVSIPASGTNVMVTGDPHSGKSWIAGWVAERLIERGYRLCIIDPEGDYLSLAARPLVVEFGQHLALPNPVALVRALQGEPLSAVLTLAALSLQEQIAYVEQVLGELEANRARSGLPHWVLIDEAQYFFRDAQPACRYFSQSTSNYLLVTYRPSLLPPNLFDAIGAHLIARTCIDDERYFISRLLTARAPSDLVAADELAKLELPRVGLFLNGEDGGRWQTFIPGRRATEHTHHGRKYADAQLPENLAFRFLHAGDRGPVAHNVGELCDALRAVPTASLRHHLVSGDFSRWVADVLGHPHLATRLRKVERIAATGAPIRRDELLIRLQAAYPIEC